jgi:hypothetical protein
LESQFDPDKYSNCIPRDVPTNSLDDEQYFREKYSQQLRSLRGTRELEEERAQVRRQEMKTPGRRGEKIKFQEIDNEITRRYFNKS